MLEIRNISKFYGFTPAVKAVSFTAKGGEIIGLLGENGAGKTTLIKTIMGFLPHEKNGDILLDGEPIRQKDLSRIAYASSEHTFFGGLTPKEHLEFYKAVYPKFDEKRFALLMEFFGLPMNKAVRHFSLGMKNQFEVTLALSQGADYILMDEPFSGSDIFGREDFYKLMLAILRPDETVILSTHLIEEVRYLLTRVLVIQKGELIADKDLSELEEEGTELTDWLKQVTGRTGSRAAELIRKMEEGDS